MYFVADISCNKNQYLLIKATLSQEEAIEYLKNLVSPLELELDEYYMTDSLDDEHEVMYIAKGWITPGNPCPHRVGRFIIVRKDDGDLKWVLECVESFVV